ncbi:MAG: T9SS type A sorting domain-containing protein [Bacteroidota bacterium]
MIKYLTLLIIIIFSVDVNAQLTREMQWLIGYTDFEPNTKRGTLLDFSEDSLFVSSVPKYTPERGGHSQICDFNGNILLYTNGCAISNKNHQLLQNGDSITSDFLLSEYCETLGDPLSQSVILLTSSENTDIYYLFNYNLEILSLDTSIYSGSVAGMPTKLYFHKVDMSDSGGKVVEKKTVVIRDTLSAGNMQAVRHANGEAWWLLVPEGLSNCYYTILVDEEGYHEPIKQCIGHQWDFKDWAGMVTFSPNGKHYVRYDPNHGLHIFDFDRCAGQLSNPLHITIDSVYAAGVAFSADSRFLYATTSWRVLQFDMHAPDIAASETLVATYDGFVAFAPTNFYMAKLAADDKIYMAGTSSSRFLHVIHHPERKGVACDVRQHSLEIPSNHVVGLPNIPHYRLGKAEESCKEVVDVDEHKSSEGVSLYPNPANENIILQHQELQWKIGRLYDAHGQLLRQFYPNGVEQTLIPIHDLSNGIYYLSIFSGTEKWSTKFVIQH